MYCKQTGKLLARVAESMPHMHSDTMQQWIDNPLGLQRVLKRALNPSLIIRPAKMSVWKTSLAAGDFAAVTPAELGFANGNVTAGEICDRALEIGLELCSRESFRQVPPGEIGNGLIVLIGSVSPSASHCGYIEFCKNGGNHSVSGQLNLNETRPGKVRWLFRILPK